MGAFSGAQGSLCARAVRGLGGGSSSGSGSGGGVGGRGAGGGHEVGGARLAQAGAVFARLLELADALVCRGGGLAEGSTGRMAAWPNGGPVMYLSSRWNPPRRGRPWALAGGQAAGPWSLGRAMRALRGRGAGGVLGGRGGEGEGGDGWGGEDDGDGDGDGGRKGEARGEGAARAEAVKRE